MGILANCAARFHSCWSLFHRLTSAIAEHYVTIQAIQRRDGAILVLLPKGRIEAPDIEEFEKPIQERIRNGDSNIIIDFGEVEAIDSAGIHSLLSIAARVVIRHGKLVVCGLGTNIRTLFSVTSCDQVVEIVDSYDDAVKSFR
ncbi:MAG: STAS domain-containing protein [Chloroflexi bacterium]|nr:STAS domain-containing protein [Chloroflexota bacterium]MYK61695.1 STAS domain-containing protein [Chloroflexota bacterium]